MSRLPEPHCPVPEMSWAEQRQYLDARLWHSRAMELCFVCETEFDLQEYEGGLICSTCRYELEGADPAGLGLDQPWQDIDPGWSDPTE